MAKELTTRESTDVALSKSKSFIGIIKNIFNNKVIVEDDTWVQRLWAWADENEIEWFEDNAFDKDGNRRGEEKNKELLLNLEILNIQESELSNIPKEIGKLVNLSELYLSSNQLKYLPREIGNLTNLNILLMSNNQLVELPKELGNLDNLLKLALPDNKLINLPREIGDLLNLTANT